MLLLLACSPPLARRLRREEGHAGARGLEAHELMLDYFPNADHAGIYAARRPGDFKDAGLNVDIRQPPDPAAPLKQVAAGRVDLAISYEPEVLRARDQGLNVAAVGALVEQPLTSIISLPEAGIRPRKTWTARPWGRPASTTRRPTSETILARPAEPAKVKERNVGFSLRPPCSPEGRRHAGRLLELRGRRPEAAGQQPRIIPGPRRGAT